jgi:hypothetical protein
MRQIDDVIGISPRAWFDKLTTNGIFDKLTTNGIFDRLATNGAGCGR